MEVRTAMAPDNGTRDEKSNRSVSGAPVNRQVVLPFGKSLDIAIKSLRARFLRSMVTTLSLVLAVAFLSYIWCGTTIADGMLSSGEQELRAALEAAGWDLEPGQTRVASSPKIRWIVALSLLVCVVGIVNAQLMAVTERFREIGTMKCLGALDRFVLRLFLLEAGMQGLAGAAVGALLGGMFAVLGNLARYGWRAVDVTGFGDLAMAMVLATAVGCLLSLVGVLYPALVAARMEPVVAMRSEM
ncbi:MAG: ABC transporter permease [Desulfatibacillaceae bacterium]